MSFPARVSLTVLVLLSLLLSCCGYKPVVAPIPAPPEPVGVEEDHTVTVRITAVGDLLMHMPVVNSAYDHSRGSLPPSAGRRKRIDPGSKAG